jgi:cellobiose-specific phosphotransferase system component IIC
MYKAKLIIGASLIIGLFYPAIVYAQEGTQTPLGEVSTFGELISLIWAYGSNVIIAMAIFFIVLGAFFYIASAGNEEKVGQGKEMIFGAIIAIIVVMLSGVLIRVLHKPAEGTTGALSEIPDVIGNATNILIGLIGTFTILMLVYAAFMYLTGRGEADKIEKAHNAFRYAVYGLIIGILAYTIANAVIRFLL